MEVKMNSKMIAKQIIDFNKANFDNTFDAITILQNHSEKMIDLFLAKATFFPPEGKKVIGEWVSSFKKGREDFKTAVDSNFKSVEDFFVNSEQDMNFSFYNFLEKTGACFGGFPAGIRKMSEEAKDISSSAKKEESASGGAKINQARRRAVKAVKK